MYSDAASTSSPAVCARPKRCMRSGSLQRDIGFWSLIIAYMQMQPRIRSPSTGTKRNLCSLLRPVTSLISILTCLGAVKPPQTQRRIRRGERDLAETCPGAKRWSTISHRLLQHKKLDTTNDDWPFLFQHYHVHAQLASQVCAFVGMC
jgi:hypothetical protein